MTTYQVKSSGSITLNYNECGVISGLGPYYGEPIKGDFVLFYVFEYSNKDFTAAARPCDFDPDTGRPISGEVAINTRHFSRVGKAYVS